MTTCPYRLMADAGKKLNNGILYLSPLHICEREIIGYLKKWDHPDLVDLTEREREREDMDKTD